MRRRVAITGVGAVSSIGLDADRFWAGCLEGRTTVAAIPERWERYAEHHSRLWSPLSGLDFEAFGFARVERAQHDPVTLLAARASDEALGRAGFEPTMHDRRARTFRIPGVDTERAAVFAGTGVGGAHSFLENHAYQILSRPRERLAREIDRLGPQAGALGSVLSDLAHGPRFNPFVVSMLMPNAVAAMPALRFGFNGPSTTYAMACASGTVAIGQGYRAVRDGVVDLALAGGSEYLDDPHGGIFHGFDVARTLVRECGDPDGANRPFDSGRSGFLFAEGGAAMLVLEPLDAALARGARPIAEISGYAESFDAHSMMTLAPDGVQIERMLGDALADAAIPATAVGLVNAHGTGTEVNDAVEAQVIARVFGAQVPVTATKSLLGHTIGASGALEAVASALSLRDQTTHACRNLDDPIADLAFVREAGPLAIEYAVSQSFAFGGHNACLVMRRL